MEGISPIAEEIWYQMTGGAIDSEPYPEDIQFKVEKAAAWVALQIWDKKYKEHMQHDPDGNLSVPFPGLPLSNLGNYAKVLTLPEKPLNLPRGKGLFATYGDPEKKLPIYTKTEILNFGSGSMFLKWQGPAYGVWVGDKLEVYDRCAKVRPSMPKLNLYISLANETTITPDMEFMIKSEVYKELAQFQLRPDQVDDANTTR